MMKFFRSFRKFQQDGAHPFETAAAAFDEGFNQGVMTGKAAARPEQEALDRAYSTGYRLGYISAHSGGGVPGAHPDPAPWISGADRR